MNALKNAIILNDGIDEMERIKCTGTLICQKCNLNPKFKEMRSCETLKTI